MLTYFRLQESIQHHDDPTISPELLSHAYEQVHSCHTDTLGIEGTYRTDTDCIHSSVCPPRPRIYRNACNTVGRPKMVFSKDHL